MNENPYAPPLTATVAGDGSRGPSRLACGLVGMLLFVAVTLLVGYVAALLLYEFVFGDDRAYLLWISIFPGAGCAALLVGWYARRIRRGAGTRFVVVVGVSSFVVLFVLCGGWFADRMLHW